MAETATISLVIETSSILKSFDIVIQKIKQIKSTFSDMANFVGNCAKRLIESIQKIQEKFKKLNDTFTMIRNVAQRAFMAIVKFTSTSQKVLEKFAEITNSILTDLRNRFNENWELVIDITGEGFTWLKKLFPQDGEENLSTNIAIDFVFNEEKLAQLKNGFESGDWSSVLGISSESMTNGISLPVNFAFEASEKGSSKEDSNFDSLANIIVASVAAILASSLGPEIALTVFSTVASLEVGEKTVDLGEEIIDLIAKHFEDLKIKNESSLSFKEYADWDDFERYFGFPALRSSGGFISGPGTGTSDSIPTMLSNGEFVINAASTRKWRPILELINNGNIKGFRTGGMAHVAGIGGNISDSYFTNTITLIDAGLIDNPNLAYLAKISKDTENFKLVVQLIDDLQTMKNEMKKQLDDFKKKYEEITKQLGLEIGNNDDDSSTEAGETGQEYASNLENIIELALSNLGDLFEGALGQLAYNLTNAIRTLNSHSGGFDGVFSEVINLFTGEGSISERLSGLSKETVAGIVDIFDSIRDFIIGLAQERAEKAHERFQESVEKFREAVDTLVDSVKSGGSLSDAQSSYNTMKEKAEKAAEDYAKYQDAKKRAESARRGAGFGGFFGGLFGLLIGGPVGAVIGAGIGGAVGAGAGYALGGANITEEQLKKYQEQLEEAKEKLRAAIQDSFGLDTQDFLSNLNKDVINAINSGEDIGNAIGTSIYGSIKNSMLEVFVWATNELVAEKLEPILEKITDSIMSAVTEGTNLDLNNLISINELIEVAKEAEEQAKMMDEMIEQYKEKLREAGIDEEIIKQIFPLTEAEKEAQKISEILRGALSKAIDSGNVLDFSASVGESIYNNVKDGLIKAFMESDVYQKMFEKWFQGSDIEFTGNLEQDFETIKDLLSQLEQQLKGAGLGFNFSEIPTVGNGASLDEGIYGAESYFAPSTLEAGRDMAETFATAIDQFVISTNTLVSTLNQLADEIKNQRPVSSTKPVAHDQSFGEKLVVLKEEHNHYHYDPKINNLFADDDDTLYKKIIRLQNRVKDNEEE